jgi:filamentous hemagglutinin family protein
MEIKGRSLRCKTQGTAFGCVKFLAEYFTFLCKKARHAVKLERNLPSYCCSQKIIPGKQVMNRIYRLVWSQVNRAWVAVAENAKGHGKSISAHKLVAAAAALIGGSLLASSVYAADAGNATVVGGAGSVSQSGATTTINQSSQRLAIDWTGLSTAANEALVFKQPNASAIALNRITGSSPSTLLGSLTANGQVYILNPNGVLFGAGAQVNVGGLVASTLTMNPADFMNGSSTFTKDPNAAGTVDNQGTLTAANGGYIALLSGTVRNEGTIDAPLGTALLAAGDKVTLNVNNGSLIGYSIDQGDLNALIDNKQLIRADGGQVLMVAKALDTLSSAVINNTGIVEARTVQNKNGHILLLGDMDVGTVNVGGTLDASAPTTGDGGKIETSAAHVKVADGTVVTTLAANGLTGSWLIDPIEFTIAASGGDMTGAEVDAELAMNNIGLSSGGDINVNDTISWNAATTLTLNANGNIDINQSITASNAGGGLALLYGQNAANAGNTATYNIKAPINLQAGNNFSTQLGNDGTVIQYTVITSLGNPGSTTGTDLQGINGNLSDNYVLGSDIDASATSTWNSGAGFMPIGQNFNGFQGVFDGLGHVISNLTINRPGMSSVGMFGTTGYGSTIRNVGLVGNNILGASYVGALVGKNYGTVDNSFATGVVANVDPGPVRNGLGLYGYSVGGLVGVNYGTVSNSYVTGTVNGSSYSTYVGGLVGTNYGTVSNSYAAGGAVNGRQYIGGLVGRNMNFSRTIDQATAGMISNSYATDSVGGAEASYGGGLVGQNYGGSISDSYAAGLVTASFSSGGLVGINPLSNLNINPGIITGAFWNIDTTGLSNGIGLGFGDGTNSFAGVYTGIDNMQASQLSTFAAAGWNIDATGGTGTIWRMYEGQVGPLLRSFLTPITVTGDATDRTYGGTTDTASTYTTNVNGATLDGSLNYVTSKNAGAYSSAGGTLAQSGLYSGQQGGYDISYADASLTIDKADVTLSAPTVNKTYDGTTAASGTAVASTGTIFTGDSLSGSLAYTDKNAGAGDKTVTAGGVTINDGNGGNNYNVTYVDNTASTIDQANITLSTTDVTKTYDGTTSASGTVDITAGTMFGTDSLSGGSFAFTDKNAGSGDKTVTAGGVTVNDGNGGNNYNVTYADNTTSTINQADVTLSTSDVIKTYDGTTTASGSAIVASGAIFTGDSLSGGSFAFTDKNAGSGDKTVTAGGVTIDDGNGGNNYNVTYADNTTSTINKADLTVTATGVDKVYDGSTNATVIYGDNRIAGDDLSFTGTASFADKNAGNDKAVTVSNFGLNGADASNYNLIASGSTTADITPASLTVTADSADKSYDGQPYSGGNGVTIDGLVNGETIADLMGTLGYGGSSQGAAAAGNYAITPGGLNSGNYNISFVDGVLSIKALAVQAAPTLGPAYDDARETVASMIDSDDQGSPSGKKDHAFDKPGFVADTDRSSPSTAAQVTPRLSLAGCGMSMPADAGGSCQ